MIKENVDFIKQSCDARLIQMYHTSFEGVSTDSRTITPDQLFIPLVGPLYNGHDFIDSAIEKGASILLVSQASETTYPEGVTVLQVKDTLKALQQLAKNYLQTVDPKRVAITGSTGKSSTKELVYAVLSQKFKTYKTTGNFNNHIGLPLTILNMPKETEVIVLEMGMNHYGEIRTLCEIAEPDDAIITNIGDSHIEYFGSREGILKAKLEIAEAFTHKNGLILNGDDVLLKSLTKADYSIIQVGENNTIYFSDYQALTPFESRFILHANGCQQVVNFPFIGRHNASNALLAAAIGLRYGLSVAEIARGLESTTPLKMRLQVKEYAEMLLVDDTYNASPDSVLSAISTLLELPAKRFILVFADILELGEHAEQIHSELGVSINRLALSKVYSFGAMSMYMHQKLNQIPSVHFETSEQLAEALLSEVAKGDAILFKGSRGMKVELVLNKVLERGVNHVMDLD